LIGFGLTVSSCFLAAETFPQNWGFKSHLLACGWLKQVFSCRSVWGKMSRSLTFYVRIAIWGINEKILKKILSTTCLFNGISGDETKNISTLQAMT
jgi:hypothetical protein